MRVHIIEAFKGGHHTNYIDALIPGLLNALKDGIVSEVTITITKSHYDDFLKDIVQVNHSQNIKFIPTFPEINPDPSFKERIKLFYAIRDASGQVNADIVITPSADYDVMINAIFNLLKLNRKTHKSIGIFHYGYPNNVLLSGKELFKKRVYEFAWRNSSWYQFFMVNPIVYESLKLKKDFFSHKIKLLPDPIAEKVNLSKMDARLKLGLPLDALYIGYIGMIDERKALPEVLKTFSDDKLYSKCHLLLAGQIAKCYSDLISNHYQHLIDSKKIITINRHLTKDELNWCYAAVDIVLILQYRRINLSANLLKAMSYDKPIIADDCGYTGMMVRRFKLGYLCHVEVNQSIKQAITQAISEVALFQPSAKTTRLKAFHHPDNYVNTIFQFVDTGQKRLLTWEWVCEELSGD